MNVVITGANRGIGLELARIAKNEGARVLAVARQPSRELEALGVEILKADVTDPEIGAKLESALKEWNAVDLLFNNAGVWREGTDAKAFQESFAVNSIAPFTITTALTARLKKSKSARVVQVTSKMGSIDDNESGGYYAYRASKAALNMLNKSLAHDNPWLKTIVIHPGWVQTDMGGKSAPVKPAESAAGLWRVANGLEQSQSGRFFDYQGQEIPW